MKWRLAVLAGVAAAVGILLSAGGVSAGEYKIEETPLGNLMREGLTVSKDGCHFAYAARGGSSWWVVVEGVAGPLHDDMLKGSLVFSPDGKRVAYGACKGKKEFVVVDGVAGPDYDGIGTLVFSPDGKRTAYIVGKGAKQCFVVDGVAGPDYDGILKGDHAFQADGTVEYLALRGDFKVFRVKHIPTGAAQ